jgi:hypothetical protein
MTRTVRIARSILAPIGGYAVIVVGTTMAFRLAHGINLGSPPSHLVFGTMGILMAGLIGGAVAAWIGGRKPVAHAASVLIFLLVDATTVLFFRPRHEPLWFGLMTALGLMGATVAGGFAYAILVSRRQRELGEPAVAKV